MTGGLGVRMPDPISNEEMNLGVMLLHIAHTHPEVVTEKRFIRCSEITFPASVVNKFANIIEDTGMVTLPPDTFSHVVSKLISAELLCRLTTKRGKVIKKTAPFLPVILIDDSIDPMIQFTAAPQCYFEEEEQDGQIVRQMKPKGEMLQFMRDHLNKE